MGNYEEYIKGLAAVGGAPLRPLEPTPVRTHAFGNPFKTDKKSLAIDEVRSVSDPFLTQTQTSFATVRV